MTTARVGRAFDTYLATYFSNRGYLATKSAGSKGLADVVAVSAHPGRNVLLIQAKAGDEHRITAREWNGLYHLARTNPCVTALAAFRGPDGPVFYELLGELEPRTRSERLPWQPWTVPPARKMNPKSSIAPGARSNGVASSRATARRAT